MAYSHYRALGWFRLTIAVGFAANLLFVLPGLFAPRVLETLIEVGTTNAVHWLQNVALLLAIITAAYVPVYKDPFRYEFLTYLVVAGRFAAGSLFWLGVLFMDYPAGMRVLGSVDIVLSVTQAVLLYFVLRAGDPRAA